MEENIIKNADNIQRELPIQSSEPFLYEYWKVFFDLYFRKLSNKYINKNSGNYPKNLLNYLFLPKNKIFITFRMISIFFFL